MRGPRARVYGAACLLWLTLPSKRAHADEERSPYHFANAVPGWSVSGSLGLGLTATSTASVGYGQPHWLWVGADAKMYATSEFAAQAASLRLVVPVGELGFDVRRTAAFSRHFLADRAEYSDAELEDHEQDPSDYQVLEAWFAAYLPLPIGIGFASAWIDRVYGVPDGRRFFDELTRVVAEPPWVGSEQLAFLVYLGSDKHRLGPIVEHVWSSRDSADVVKLGPMYSAELTPHLSLLVYCTEPVVSPDSLGLWNDAGGTLIFRYSWSSTDPGPAFP